MLIFGANGVNLKTLYGWRVCIYCINWLEDSGNMRGFHDNTGLVTSNFKDEEQIYNPCSLFDSLRSRCSWRRREALRRQVWSRHSLDWQLLIIWASETPAHADTVNVHVVTLTHWVCVCVCVSGLLENAGIGSAVIPQEQKVYLLTTALPPYCGECWTERLPSHRPHRRLIHHSEDIRVSRGSSHGLKYKRVCLRERGRERLRERERGLIFNCSKNQRKDI